MTKRIAIITSGSDAPAMNACIRSTVLRGLELGFEMYGYKHGYQGILDDEILPLHFEQVNNLIQLGGTILHSARSNEFATEQGQQKAAHNLTKRRIDGLIVIGGDGSFRGAHALGQCWSGQIIGIPGTIDNDIAGTDATIGFYTAIETALESIDKVRDTADAFERIFLVEVMGRHAGFLALRAALASASDYVILPENFTSQEQVLDELIKAFKHKHQSKGPVSFVIVVAENVWPGGTSSLADALTLATKCEVRPVILGHVQRGGSPTSQDRILATLLGHYAIDAFSDGVTDIMIGRKHAQIIQVPLTDTWTTNKPLNQLELDVMNALSKNGYA